MIYAKDIDSIEIHHLFDFSSVMIDKVVEFSTIIGAKYAVATIFLFHAIHLKINIHWE